MISERSSHGGAFGRLGLCTVDHARLVGCVLLDTSLVRLPVPKCPANADATTEGWPGQAGQLS
jgi:hypothetical protein